MRRCFHGFLIATALVAMSIRPGSAQVPPEFQGVFVMPPEQQGEPLSCGRDNNDGEMKIQAKSIEMYEHQCDVVSLRRLKPDTSSAKLRLSCSGEGNKWNTRELWSVRQIESRATLVRTQLQLTETQFEGKPKRGKPRDDVHVTVYVKCPAATQ